MPKLRIELIENDGRRDISRIVEGDIPDTCGDAYDEALKMLDAAMVAMWGRVLMQDVHEDNNQ